MFAILKNLLRSPEAKASRTAQLIAFESGGRARWSPRDQAGADDAAETHGARAEPRVRGLQVDATPEPTCRLQPFYSERRTSDFPGMVEPAYILFDGNGGGEFAFGCVTGAIYGAGDSDAIEFGWCGNDEMNEVNGDGWV